jgi:8-oxo-dGTP diphosphatase
MGGADDRRDSDRRPPLGVSDHTGAGMTGSATPGDDGAPVHLRCSVLFFRGDSVLLCRRVPGGQWVLPGGTPRPGESAAGAARREVDEETGLQVSAERVAFVFEASSWDRDQHLVEIVFLGAERERSAQPTRREPSLDPQFVPVSALASLELRPPIAGYIRGFLRHPRSGAYLGNVWRPNTQVPSPPQ